MREKILTKKQQETLSAIREYIRDNSKSPTVTELANILELASYQSVTDRIDTLRRKGLIRKNARAWRGIELVEDNLVPDGNRLIQVPLVASAGCDHMAIFAHQEYDKFIRVEEKLLQGHREVVAIHAIGNSMQDAGIRNGDYVLIEPEEEHAVENGDRVAAIVDGMAVVKKIGYSQNAIVLYPETKDSVYEPIVFTAAMSSLKIVGRVFDVLSFYESDEDDVTIVPVYE